MADWSRSNNNRGNNNNNNNRDRDRDRDRNYRGGDNQEYRNFNNRNREFRERNNDVPTDPPYIAFVGNLPKGLVQGDVMKIFEDFEVKNVRLIKDRETDEFKGYGYVEFTTLEQLKRALSHNGRIKLDNLSAPLRIDIADHRRQGGSGGGGGGSGGGRGGGGGGGGSASGSNGSGRQGYRRDSSPGRLSGHRGSSTSSFRSDRGQREVSPRQGGYQNRGNRGNHGNRGGGGYGRARYNNDNYQGVNDGSNSSDYGSLGGNSLGSPRQNVESHKSSTSFQSTRSFPHYSNGGGGGGNGNNYNHRNNNNRYNNNTQNNSNNNNNGNNFRRGGGGGAQRQRSISNDNSFYSNFGQNRNRDRRGHYNPNDRYTQPPTSATSIAATLDDQDRPKIVLKPRSVAEPINALADTKQAASIFGSAKPRMNQDSTRPDNDDSQPGSSNRSVDQE